MRFGANYKVSPRGKELPTRRSSTCTMFKHPFMALASTLARSSRWLTQATGVLLILLGLIHLVATPFYIGWASRTVSADSAPLVIAGLKLNHVLFGILLIPFGMATFWAGRSLEEIWAFRLATLNAATILLFPVLLALLLPAESLEAPLFRLAILVLTMTCLTQVAALAGLWVQRRKKPA